MIDRKIQFGYAMYDSAVKYAKNAKTPNEFMDLISEHDLKNLRQMFKSTPDKEFEGLKKGLVTRIENRKKEALNLGAPLSSNNEKSSVKPKSGVLTTNSGDIVRSSSGEPIKTGTAGTASIEPNVQNKGEKIDSESHKNKQLKKDISPDPDSVTIINNTTQTPAPKQNSPRSSETNESDDEALYYIKHKKGKL